VTADRYPRTLRAKVAAIHSFALLLVLLAAVLAGCAHDVPGASPNFVYDPKVPSNPPDRPELKLKDDDRILVLAPHPDDEVLAAGGLVQQAIAKGLPVKVVFLTNGDNNEFAYLYFSKAFTLDAHSAVDAGQTRAFEALRAGRELGLEGGEETFLGYPDFGTLEIWKSRWGDAEAFRSMFSEQNQVPYWFARTPDAPYKGESILKDLSEVIADFKPTKVFVSHPADTNPDHVAYNLFLRTALWDLEGEVKPEVHNYLTHYGEWPQPRGLLPDAPLEPPAQLDEAGRWVVLSLEPDQVNQKLAAIKRHKTQYGASKAYLDSYMRANELFDRMEDIVLTAESPSAVILPSGTGVVGAGAAPESPAMGVPRKVRVEGNDLVFSFDFGEQGDSEAGVEMDVMGCRADRPFAEMPKIAINAKGSNYRVSERGRGLPHESVQVASSLASTEVRIPLDLLGNPERVHFNAAIRPGKGPPDTMPWVVLELPYLRGT
jgi:LmbE family N-acetylglucosaminyl deacetylase